MRPETESILVVDADAGRRRLVGRILGAEGFAVTAVPEGFSALRAVQARPFALAIVATALPGSLDGAATLRQARRFQPLLKALLTAASPPLRSDPAADEVLVAPIHGAELLGCVFALLRPEPQPGSDLALRWRDRRRAR